MRLSVCGRIILAALVFPCAVARAQFAPPTDAAFAEQAHRLGPKNDRATRFSAVKWLNAHSGAKNAGPAMPALERSARQEPDREIRGQAVLTLGLIARSLGKPCPLAVVEALLDREEEVRWQAQACAGCWPSGPFAPGSVEVLLRAVRSPDVGVRSSSLFLLALAGGKEPKVLTAIRKAREDRVFEVRHCAHCALFSATNRLDEFLLYLIRLREDPESLFTPGLKEAERKQEQKERNLALLGSSTRLIEWSEHRADELAPLLVKLLNDESPVVRRGAVNLIGATVVKVVLPPRGQQPGMPGGNLSSLLPYVAPQTSPQTAPGEKKPEKSKTALRLEKLKVEERLRTLRDRDPDGTVREAAGRALARIALVNERKPTLPPGERR
jgi:HEAT repeat